VLRSIRREIKDRKYQALICHSTDRLARNPIHLAIIAEECERAGCELHSVTEPLDNSNEAQLIRYVKGYAAQMEREKTRERTIRGKEEIMSNRQLVCVGWACYGYVYDRETRVRVIDAQAAAIVKMIFDWYQKGMSTGLIAAELNRLGIPIPTSRLGHTYKKRDIAGIWTFSTVVKILKNEAYMGKTFWGTTRASGARNASGRYKQEATPRDEWRVLDDKGELTPRLIEDEQFYAVREIMGSRGRSYGLHYGKKPSTAQQEALLRGRITCGCCGLPMYTCIRPLAKQVYYYYICKSKGGTKGAKAHAACSNGVSPIAHADEAVWAWVCDLYRNPDVIRKRFEEIQAQTDDTIERETLASLDEKLDSLKRQYAKGYKRYAEEDDPDLAEIQDRELQTIKRQIAAYREERAICAGRVDALNGRKAAEAFTEEMLANAADLLRRDADFDTRLKAIEALRITVYAQGKEYKVGFERPTFFTSPCHSSRTSAGKWPASTRRSWFPYP